MTVALDFAQDLDETREMVPETCRAGRALVGISRTELAKSAGVSLLTVTNYENGQSEPSHKTWRALRQALIERGVVFLDADENGGAGVRLR